MYILIALLLTIFSIVEIGNENPYRKQLFLVFMIGLTLLLAVRYGQGTDYYGYYLQYTWINPSADYLVNSLYHGELGWYILLMSAKRIGLSFELFVAILSIVMMYAVGRSIKKYSPYRITSLLILYPTFYLTYFFSAIRQGLVLSLFLGFGLDLLIEKKYVRYYLLTVVLVFIHRSAALLLCIPLLMMLKNRKIEKYIFLAVGMGILFGYTGVLNRIGNELGIISYFSVSISVMAILLRFILFYVVYRIHKKNIVNRITCDAEDEMEDMLYFIYLIGFVIYLTLAFSANLSQRLTMPLKAIEIILLPLLFRNMNKIIDTNGSRVMFLSMGSLKVAVLAIVVILMINVETVKNINSYINQGNYYSWVNPINYPYCTIFDKDNIKNYISHFDNEVE